MQRRSFLILLAGVFGLKGCQHVPLADYRPSEEGVLLNDLHSRLNETLVRELHTPKTIEELQALVSEAADRRQQVSVSGSRHAMGGQQFGSDTIHISTRDLKRVISFDRVKGLIEVEAGIEWPTLIEYLLREQQGSASQWAITQKQTGADKLSIGGSVSANIHGRGVHFKPFVQDVEALSLIDGSGEFYSASRNMNPELFRLVVGGYGLFGALASVTLRLSRRCKLERTVEVLTLEELPEKVRMRIRDGYTYGDFQYKTDPHSSDFMEKGVFSCYRPVPDDTPIPSEQRKLSAADWNSLLYLAHKNKSEAFRRYSDYYLSTSGQVYWSDLHQLSYYDPEYHSVLTERDPTLTQSSLMISELYVPRSELVTLTRKIKADALKHEIDIVYGTMRIIKRDDETFLPWATDNFACVIFNLRVEHTSAGIQKASQDFQRLIDRALELRGSYYLTYHRWARKDQLLAAYPQFPKFLDFKQQYDPSETFQSNWYRHYRGMFI